MLGKLSFAGPRVKCGISLQPASSFKADEGSIDYSDDWASNKLVQAAHGGQVKFATQMYQLALLCS